jgi:hemolysin D
MPLLLRPSSKAISVPRAERDDAALPAILEFQMPSIAITEARNPVFSRATIWMVVMLFVSTVAAMGLIPIDEVVEAHGTVISRAPSILVQPFDESIVRSIDVHQGQFVHAGDLLARLDPTLAAADEQNLIAQVSSYGAQVARWQAEEDNKPFKYSGTNPDMLLQVATYDQRQAQYNYTVENWNQQIAAEQSLITQSDASAAGYRDRLGLAKSLQQMRTQLEKLQVGSKIDTLAAMDNAAEMTRSMIYSEQQAASARGTMASLMAQRDAFIQQWRADISSNLAQNAANLVNSQQQLAKAQLHRQLVVLRADRDAYVMQIAKVSIGSVLQIGQQFITLEPADAPLETEVNILGSDQGEVQPGQHVDVKFDTFDYLYYGMADGTVRVVAPNSFFGQDLDTNLAGAVPVQPTDPNSYYRARIAIDQLHMHNVSTDFHLIPGMPVTTDIRVGKRTALSYILSRIAQVPSEAMREPTY